LRMAGAAAGGMMHPVARHGLGPSPRRPDGKRDGTNADQRYPPLTKGARPMHADRFTGLITVLGTPSDRHHILQTRGDAADGLAREAAGREATVDRRPAEISTIGRIAAVGTIAILLTGSAAAAAEARPRNPDTATQVRSKRRARSCVTPGRRAGGRLGRNGPARVVVVPRAGKDAGRSPHVPWSRPRSGGRWGR
jgi:hypothetical protein